MSKLIDDKTGYAIVLNVHQHASQCRTLHDALHEDPMTCFKAEDGFLLASTRARPGCLGSTWLLFHCPFCGEHLSQRDGTPAPFHNAASRVVFRQH